jgi:hypothetical protein
MCGDGFASPKTIPLMFWGYAPCGGIAALVLKENLSERQSLSAHQAAKPHRQNSR